MAPRPARIAGEERGVLLNDGVEGVRLGVLGVSAPVLRRGVYEACSAGSVLRRMPNLEVASRRAAGDICAILWL